MKKILICLMLATVGCVTIPGGNNIVPLVLSKQEFSNLKLDENGTVSKDQATAIRKALCSGAKPQRAVKSSIKFIMPTLPGGIATDEAEKIMQTYRLVMNRQVSMFFAKHAFGFDGKRQLLSPTRPFGLIGLSHPFLFLQSKDASAKPLAILAGSSAGNAVRKAGYQNMVTTYKGKKLGYDDATGLDDCEYQNCIAPIMVIDQQTRAITMTMVDKTFSMPSEYQQATSVELRALQQYFTILVSPSTVKAWDEVAEARGYGVIETSLPDKRDEGAPLGASDLLKRHDGIWISYLVSNTKIVESATDDPNVFAFELTLNTEPFCRLGRPTDQLLSH